MCVSIVNLLFILCLMCFDVVLLLVRLKSIVKFFKFSKKQRPYSNIQMMSKKMEVEETLTQEGQIQKILVEYEKFQTATEEIERLLDMPKYVCWMWNKILLSLADVMAIRILQLQ